MKLSRILFIVLALFTTAPLYASTWSVAQDGSGDFTVIQDAVDAAASGDVINVGPGRYTEYTTYSWGISYLHFDGQKDLTVVGAGPEETIIGPVALTTGPDSYGVSCAGGACSLVVENLKVMNQNHNGIILFNDDAVILSCHVEFCKMGIALEGEISRIQDSRVLRGFSFLGDGIWCRSPHVQVINTTVIDYAAGLNFDYSGSTDVLIKGCHFDGGEMGMVGAMATFGAGGTVEDCYFTNWRNYAFSASDGGTITLRNNVMENNPGNGVGFEGMSHLDMQENIITGCGTCIFVGEPNGTQVVRNNHFLRDEANDGYFVRCLTYYPHAMDLVNLGNNYWGTTDIEEIQTWIFDGHDSDRVNLYITFLPLADGPVSTEATTLDGLKAMFR